MSMDRSATATCLAVPSPPVNGLVIATLGQLLNDDGLRSATTATSLSVVPTTFSTNVVNVY
ncbi:hypothetical protein PF003_g40044 [Phytophthora fragariae]|nr:hypothetical protein PF003_g40044 [Phytophthora fragariae]